MVNPAIHAGHVAAAAAAKARREVLERMRAVHATDAPRAVRLEGLEATQSRALDRLLRNGMVRSAGDQRYYLDERKIREHEDRQRQAARLVLLALLVGAIVMLGALGLSVAVK